LGQISSSLGLIPNRIKYDVYDGTTSSTRDFGINEPCHMLLKSGNMSTELEAIERQLRAELRSHNPRYEGLQDAVTRALRLPWWKIRGSMIEYAPFVVVWCPESRYAYS
jgi:hypothetical protein